MNTNPLSLAAVRSAARDSARVADAIQIALGRQPQYDLARAIRIALARENRLDGFEGERDQELRRQHARHLCQTGTGFYVGAEDLAPLLATRANVVSTLSTGGYLVETANAGFIELARPRSVTLTLGAVPLDGLVGNCNFPRITASISASWMPAETTAPPDGTHSLGQISLMPKEASVNIKVSKLLVTQTSPAAQALLANDLLAGLAQAIDVAALSGTGVSGQPLGIVNTSGIGTASGTTFNNSAAIDLQGAVGNRLSAMGGYAAPIATAKLLAKRTRDTVNIADYVWAGGLHNGMVAGNRAIASDNIPPSTVLYGAWDQCLIAGWGTLQVEVSPVGSASTDFQQSLIALRIIHALDVGVRDPKAFAIATSVT